ncbi:MAG: DUF3987 domain-containing protein [Paludibacter sp.]|nr:DUF3987 domain-containing protein [Paludibacter sp.]
MINKKEAPSNLAVSEEANNQEQNKTTNFIQKLKAEIHTKSMNLNANDTVFPTSGLPQVILDFGLEVAEVYGVPIEFPVLSALCAVSSALRKKFSVDSGKYRNFGQLWLMFVAPPGVGKSEPMAAAFRPLQRLDNLSYDAYQVELANWKIECSEAKQTKSQEPEKPFYKQCLIDDFTPESLYQTMFRNNGAVSLCRDELSGWFADFGRYNKSGEISRYLSIFNNAQFCINRKSEEPLQIPEPFMTICGTIQPEVLDIALNNNSLKENGFASRFLYVYPREIKKQKYSEKIPNRIMLERYEELIKHCYYLPKSENPFILSPEAKVLFIEYANHTADLVNGCSNNFLRATYAKMEIQVLRISLIIQIIRGLYDNSEWLQVQISKEAIQYAINLCNYFNSNIIRVENIETATKTTPVEAIKIIQKEYGIKNKQTFADSIGLTRQYISKLCNE